ncbi:hypothetical protein [Flagellimonas lutimaris]|uniref:hypothetical protein n=1 Tax=Flagellimonas lutimaris TaxID=475082 RepID=UPI003F5CF5F8
MIISPIQASNHGAYERQNGTKTKKKETYAKSQKDTSSNCLCAFVILIYSYIINDFSYYFGISILLY